MFEYKGAKFYTEYFRKLDGFNVINEFKESEDKEEKNLYVGEVEVLNTIHPLVLRVEIPFTFPHNKLLFRTKSLSGYPHLIHTGKIKYGDWFCLNTPFAETPEEQLDQEVLRLREWIKRQMREDLPAVIEDDEAKRALAFANAYEWENPDEVKEFSSKSMLTFVGDSQNDDYYIKQNIGDFHCIKTRDSRYYVLPHYCCKTADSKLPYAIVDAVPELTSDVLSDFLKLKELYNWDEKICNHLLPDFDIAEPWQIGGLSFPFFSEVSEVDALKTLHELSVELHKEESYLQSAICKPLGTLSEVMEKEKKLTKVLNAQKHLLLKQLSDIEASVRKNHKYVPLDIYNIPMPDEEEMNEQYCMENIWPFELHCFALGVRYSGEGIVWLVYFTNHSQAKYDEVKYDLKLRNVILKRLTSLPIYKQNAQNITEDMYFGRGSFSNDFKSKKVAIVGLGAIGSMVASALAHCGVSRFGLWDDDRVEPGNICRSAYSISNLGSYKDEAIENVIKSINPYIDVRHIQTHGSWKEDGAYTWYEGGSFYSNVNYKSQEEAINEIKDYDLILDCTGSNEMLHFLSYALPDTDILSLCITNHSNNLLCISSKDGNPFEQRKAYLSRIEQDTKNFYAEGDGCYSPTFLANHCDIASLVNLALRDVNKSIENGRLMHSTIYSYDNRGIISDVISTYKIDGYDITLNVPSECVWDADEIGDSNSGCLGYIFGCYSKDGRQILVTHIVDSECAHDMLEDAFKTSKGLIDYIGDFCYSGEQAATFRESSLKRIESKAFDESINTNNPLLVVRNPDRTLSYFLFIDGELKQFVKKD